ncbi:hypothetical protein IG631_22594 [Alternaria alternata]|nr:hypothetical protein IG631_22594 [Alternaria alternata]
MPRVLWQFGKHSTARISAFPARAAVRPLHHAGGNNAHAYIGGKPRPKLRGSSPDHSLRQPPRLYRQSPP